MFTAEYLADDMGMDLDKIVPVFVNVAAAITGTPVKVSKELQEVLDGDRVDTGNAAGRSNYNFVLPLELPWTG